MTKKERYDTLIDMRLSGRKTSFTRPWTQRQRVVLLTLIGVNVAAFVAQLFLESSEQKLFVQDFLGISKRGVEDAYSWQFITAAFMHRGPWHFICNMLVLYLLGRDVESILGQRHLLFLYLAGAFAGELAHLFLRPSTSVLLGASGGVAAVVVAYATILPELELTAMLLFLVPVRLKAKYLSYGAAIVGLVLLLTERGDTVTHSACLGGCAAGWIYAHLLGFGRPSGIQRALHQRKISGERYRQMNAEQFIAKEVDPLLEKISRAGVHSLTRRERRTLMLAREKLSEET